MSVRGSDDKNKRTVDGLVKTRQTSPTNFRLVKPARPAASSASTPVRKITIKSSRFAFLKTSKIKIGLVFLLLLAMVGGWFGYQRSNSGRVLGVAEEVRIDIPQFYTETLTVSKGNNILTVTPLEGKRVPVERYNNQYIYYTAYPYTDVIQTEYRYKIKEEMYFHQPGHPLEFKYRLGNIEAYLVEKDDKGNTFFYDKVLYQAGSERDLALNYTIPAPFVEDSSRKRDFSAVEVYVQDGLLVVKVDPVWLAQAKYPVILDPTIEINILNIYSHPQQGDDWLVDFVTQGTADLYIIPDDQATIDDDEFVSLSCAGLIRQPQILPGDIIYYPNWHCAGTGRVTHHTLKAGKHTLRFEFGDQVAYAYNDAGDSWWDTDWDYRLPIIIDNRNNTNTLTDFQVYVNVTSTVTDFWSNASNTGNDIRFTNKAGSLELPYYVTYYSTTTDEAIYWVKADSLSASVTSTIYMYYGNSLANATSSAENTFSYASREQRYVLMGDYNQNYSYLIPFFDNTSYGVGVTTITQESSDIDTAARVSLGSAVLSENGTVVSSTKPIAISGAVVSSDMWAPFAWQSTDLVGFSYVANPEIEIYNPNQTSVSVGIYEQGALDDRSPNPFTVTARAIDDTTYSGVAGNWRASSTLPVMMYIEGGANRVVVVPTLAKEWWGHARNTRIAAGANAATFNIYCSNGSTGSGSVSAYSFTSNTTCNGTYGSISAYIVADQPVTVSAHADGNGSDSQVWYSKKDLDLVHISADDYEYLACTTPYANTTFEVFTISGGAWVSQTSGTATRTGSDPNPYWYRDYTTRSGGIMITSTNPSYCYVDRDVTSDESNISNIVLNRQGTYPEPEVLLIEAQETPPASTNSPPTITQVSESADPTPAGQDLYWSVDWNDTDSGDLIKVVVCSTNSITTSTLACAATKYCQSPVYTNRDPEGLCYYTTQSPGTLNYYAFVCDNSGATNACSNGYAGSVTVEEQSPTAPSDLLTENRSQALNIDTLTPRFSAVFNDPNVQDTAIKYCIQVNSQSDFAGTDLWFSDGANCGAGNAITCSQGTRCPDITYAGTALTLNGNPYYWRINFVDSSHNTSTTSTVATFTMANSGTGVRLKGFNLKGGIRLK